MKGITYFKRWGLSINEGGTPFNIHIRWKPYFFIYIYFFGKKYYSHKKDIIS